MNDQWFEQLVENSADREYTPRHDGKVAQSPSGLGRRNMDIRRVLPFLLFVLILLIPGRALAQGAWVPRQGEAAFSINYQWLLWASTKDRLVRI